MLKSLTKGASAAALATALSVGAAYADNHTVLIMEGGFFPAVTYAKPGDNVIFTNNSQGAIILRGPNNIWKSDPIHTDDSFVLNVTSQTPMEFVATNGQSGSAGEEGETDEEYIALDDVLMEGALSFNEAPLSDSGNG